MLTEYSYIAAWGLYLLAAFVFYLCMLPIVRRLGPLLLQLLFRSILAALLFTPALSVPSENLWAPANIVALYSMTIQPNAELAASATQNLLIAWLLLLPLVVLSYVIGKRKHAKQAKEDTQAGKPQPASDKNGSRVSSRGETTEKLALEKAVSESESPSPDDKGRIEPVVR